MTVDQSNIDKDKTTVSVNLIDTVSGTLYYHGVMGNAGPVVLETDFKKVAGYMGSVNVLLCENWMVATWFNHAEKNVEVFVMEVYESEFPDDRLGESGNYSSFESHTPHFIPQIFVVPHAVGALGVSKTGNSIATREIYMALEDRGVYGISKRILDPRRPTGDDKEEGLVKYKGYLEFKATDVVSYGTEVAGVQRIVSSGSGMESTSLVLSYGLDLFFTRRSGSGVFDVLSDEFWRVGLVGTVALLGIGIVWGARGVRAKKLRGAWK